MELCWWDWLKSSKCFTNVWAFWENAFSAQHNDPTALSFLGRSLEVWSIHYLGGKHFKCDSFHASDLVGNVQPSAGQHLDRLRPYCKQSLLLLLCSSIQDEIFTLIPFWYIQNMTLILTSWLMKDYMTKITRNTTLMAELQPPLCTSFGLVAAGRFPHW